MSQLDILNSNIPPGSYDMDDGPPPPAAKINQADPPRPIITWKNRRRMAWLSLCTMVVFVSLLTLDWIPVERVTTLEPIITTFLYVLGGVIVAYMGFTSMPFIGKGR